MAETEVDDVVRARARAARREIEGAVDVDAALADVRDRIAGDGPVPSERWAEVRRDRSRPRATVLTAAAAVVALVAGLAAIGVARRADDGGPPATTPDTVDVLPTIATTVPDAAPATSLPDQDAAPTTATPDTLPAPAGVIAASSAEPPPPLALDVFAEVDMDDSDGPSTEPPVATPNWAGVEVGELGIVVNQTASGFVSVVGFDGAIREVPVGDGELGAHITGMAYGPADVLYGIRPVSEPDEFVMEAVALSGPRAGETVARSDRLGPGFTHLGTSPFGHGPDGVVDRRTPGADPLLGFVDVEGDPIVFPGAAPPMVEVDDALRVTSSAGTTWQLEVDGSTDPATTFDGPPIPAPSSNGRVVYGSWLVGGGAEQPPTGPIVAVLEADGSGTWWSVPDGWSLAGSDVWGTVFARRVGSTLQLALLDDTPRAVADPADGPDAPDAPSADWQTSLRWEASRIERACAPSGACTQVRTASDGTAVSYDPLDRTLTWHTRPIVTASVPEAYGDGVWLDIVAPGGVAYLHVDAAVPDEDGLAADLVAVVWDESGGETVELGRWDGVVDRIGDSELAPAPNGLVVVGCCGGAVRPPLDAQVAVPWVDPAGTVVVRAVPGVRAELSTSTVTIVRDERSWTFDPGDAWLGRGMPTIVPTFDGGVLVSFAESSDRAVVARGWADGTTESVEIDAAVESLDPSGIVVVANDTRFARILPFDERDDGWPGSSFVDVETGTVTFEDLDAHLVEERPSWASDPVAFADALAGWASPEESRSIVASPLDDGGWRVVWIITGFFDDSVDGVRYEIELSPAGDGTYRVVDGRWANVCRPGRGHQDFQSALCT